MGETGVSALRIETKRLVLRNFIPEDMPHLYRLLSDAEVNTFLPWFPVKTMEETAAFYEARIRPQAYFLAVCARADGLPIGYVHLDMDSDSRDFGYALRREVWRRGIAAEAGRALIDRLRQDHIPYITATHDKNNPASGRVMQKLGMRYCYSYWEQWQPKNFPVLFRMYQLNLDGQADRVYRGYWERSAIHFVESGAL